MSDFVSHDMLPDLWDEILKRLWNYLETEESVQKLEERKKLESCLKEFLCIVPHDRKFFLPETAHVLRRTVRELDNFSAYRAIIGFDSVSQYANNLFTKPWRKEFHVLKMYSGFFQHEVQSNLLDAVKLFEAMGYRQMSDDLLVLEGPICPDQVTNVSRDSMAAYVECQIMKQIYMGLEALNIDCTWQDVFHFRETHVGGSSQAIKSLAYAIQEKKLRKEKPGGSAVENCYASIQHLPQASATSHYQNCEPYAHAHKHSVPQPPAHYVPHSSQCALHGAPQSCIMHAGGFACNGCGGKLAASFPAPTASYAHPHQHLYGHNASAQPHMSHSRSLEQYNEPPPLLPHRHSFDHQQQGCMATHHYQQQAYAHAQPMHVYESPYDCVDSTSNASYAIVASSPYNVSGNRYPLPYSISSQLNTHYAAPSTVACNGIKGDAYASVAPEHPYATVSKISNCSYHNTPAVPQPPPPVRCSGSTVAATAVSGKDFNTYRQRSFPPDHLIDFDDRAPLTSHDYHEQLHALTQNHSFDSTYEQTSRQARRSASRQAVVNYAQPKDVVCAHAQAELYDNYSYARPVSRDNRVKPTTDKYSRNMQESLDNNRRLKELASAANTTVQDEPVWRKLSTQSGGLDGFVNVAPADKLRRSPTQAVKNQDGVGSFESWDFVYQNLERSGYSKDLGERGDLLVQSLDLDSLNLVPNNSGVATTGVVAAANGTEATEKRRSTELKAGRQANLEKLRAANRTLEALDAKQKPNSVASTNGVVKKTPPKSALKTSAVPVDNNNSHMASGVNARKGLDGGTAKRSTRNIQKVPTPVSTQVIVSSPNEWSCRFCTFLNSDTKRVCEMCYRSKDFNLESTATHTPTCV